MLGFQNYKIIFKYYGKTYLKRIYCLAHQRPKKHLIQCHFYIFTKFVPVSSIFYELLYVNDFKPKFACLMRFDKMNVSFR